MHHTVPFFFQSIYSTGYQIFRICLTDPDARFLSHSGRGAGTFLKIAATLEESEHIARVVPSLCKLLASNDRAIRRSLLENMDSFGTKFDAATVEDKVCLPCVLSQECHRV